MQNYPPLTGWYGQDSTDGSPNINANNHALAESSGCRTTRHVCQWKSKRYSIPDKEWQKQGLAPILQLTEIDVVIPFFQTYKEQIP